MSKALVTGICGFAGKSLRKELESSGYDVYGVDIVAADEKVFKTDLLDREATQQLIDELRPDVIFNLAGQASPIISWQDINLTMHLNVDLSVNIAESVRAVDPSIRMLFIGSANQYDMSHSEDGLIGEDSPKVSNSPYSISKNAQEDILDLMAARYGLDILMTRSFNHIGPQQRPGFVVTDYSQRIAQLEAGKIDTFTYGNLNSWRDFSDVRDVVRGYRLIAEKGQSGHIYNVGSGRSYYIRDLVGDLVAMSPAASEKTVLPERLPDNALIHYRGDISKLTLDTGYEPIYDARDALPEILNAYREMEK